VITDNTKILGELVVTAVTTLRVAVQPFIILERIPRNISVSRVEFSSVQIVRPNKASTNLDTHITVVR